MVPPLPTFVELKKGLHELFAPYGEILGVYVKNTYKMKGQAFIVFKNLQSASEAMRCLQKAAFFGKEMNIHYAKDKSDLVAKGDKTYDSTVMKKRKDRREEELKRLAEKRPKPREKGAFERPKEMQQPLMVPMVPTQGEIAAVLFAPRKTCRTER